VASSGSMPIGLCWLAVGYSRKYCSESDSRRAIASLREVVSPTDMTARGHKEYSIKDILSK
jgi:hypothetical protein